MRAGGGRASRTRPRAAAPRTAEEAAGRLAEGADEAVDWLRRVVAGERVWASIDKAGERSVRMPTGDEMIAACEKLLKYGAGTAREAEPTDAAARETDAFLDRLSPEDLATMRTIAERAHAASRPE